MVICEESPYTFDLFVGVVADFRIPRILNFCLSETGIVEHVQGVFEILTDSIRDNAQFHDVSSGTDPLISIPSMSSKILMMAQLASSGLRLMPA